MLKYASAVAAATLVFAGSAHAAAPTTYAPPTMAPLQLESPIRAGRVQPYIVCREAQARSYLNFLQLGVDAPHKEKLRAIGANHAARDGRLCETKLLDRVQLGGTIHRQTIGDREWRIISASRFDPSNRKTYHFTVVGGVDNK